MGGSKSYTKILLDESELPRQWYNIIPDLPSPPPPPLHPGTRAPLGPDDLAGLFPRALIEQEATAERYVDIPEEVLEVYRLWRPTPLFRARRLERALNTPAKIFYKYEGVSPAGRSVKGGYTPPPPVTSTLVDDRSSD
jgi:tryptophan synthase beta chain